MNQRAIARSVRCSISDLYGLHLLSYFNWWNFLSSFSRISLYVTEFNTISVSCKIEACSVRLSRSTWVRSKWISDWSQWSRFTECSSLLPVPSGVDSSSLSSNSFLSTDLRINQKFLNVCQPSLSRVSISRLHSIRRRWASVLGLLELLRLPKSLEAWRGLERLQSFRFCNAMVELEAQKTYRTCGQWMKVAPIPFNLTSNFRSLFSEPDKTTSAMQIQASGEAQ